MAFRIFLIIGFIFIFENDAFSMEERDSSDERLPVSLPQAVAPEASLTLEEFRVPFQSSVDQTKTYNQEFKGVLINSMEVRVDGCSSQGPGDFNFPHWGSISLNPLKTSVLDLLRNPTSEKKLSIEIQPVKGNKTKAPLQSVRWGLERTISNLTEVSSDLSVLNVRVSGGFFFQEFKHDFSVLMGLHFKKPVPQKPSELIYALNSKEESIDVSVKTKFPDSLFPEEQVVRLFSVLGQRSQCAFKRYEISTVSPSMVYFSGAETVPDDVVKKEENEFWSRYRDVQTSLFLATSEEDLIIIRQELKNLCSQEAERRISLTKGQGDRWLRISLDYVQNIETRYSLEREWLDFWESDAQETLQAFIKRCSTKLSHVNHSLVPQEGSEIWVPSFENIVPPPLGYYHLKNGLWTSVQENQGGRESHYEVKMSRDISLVRPPKETDLEIENRKTMWNSLLLKNPANIRSLRMDVDPFDSRDVGILLEFLKQSLNNLSFLELGLGPINNEGLEAILNTLKENNNLRDLSFTGPFSTEFKGNIIPYLLRYIEEHPSLEKITIFDETGTPIQLSKRKDGQVRVSDFHRNIKIGSLALLPVLDELPRHRKNGLLQEVKGMFFSGIHSENYQFISNFLEKNSMRFLGFSGCFGEEGMPGAFFETGSPNLEELEITHSRLPVLESMGVNTFPKLSVLKLTHFSGLENGKISNLLSIMSGKNLRHLDLTGARLPPDMIDYFRDNCHELKVLKILCLSGCFPYDSNLGEDILRGITPFKLTQLDFSHNPLPSNIPPEIFPKTLEILGLKGCFQTRIPTGLLIPLLLQVRVLDLTQNPYPEDFLSPTEKKKKKRGPVHLALIDQIRKLKSAASLSIGTEGDMDFPWQELSLHESTKKVRVTTFNKGFFGVERSFRCLSEIIFHENLSSPWNMEELPHIFENLQSEALKTVRFSGDWQPVSEINPTFLDKFLMMFSREKTDFSQEIDFGSMLRGLPPQRVKEIISSFFLNQNVQSIRFKGCRGEEVVCQKDISIKVETLKGPEEEDDWKFSMGPSDVQDRKSGEKAKRVEELRDLSRGALEIEFKEYGDGEKFDVDDLLSVFQEIVEENKSLQKVRFFNCSWGPLAVERILDKIISGIERGRTLEVSFVDGVNGDFSLFDPAFLEKVRGRLDSSFLIVMIKNSSLNNEVSIDSLSCGKRFSVTYPPKKTMVFQTPFSGFGRPLLGESLELYGPSLHHITFEGEVENFDPQRELTTLRCILNQLKSLNRPFSLTLRDFFERMNRENVLKFFEKLSSLPVEKLDISGHFFTDEEVFHLMLLFNKAFKGLKELCLNPPLRNHHEVSRGVKGGLATAVLATGAGAAAAVFTGGLSLIPTVAAVSGATFLGGGLAASSGHVSDMRKRNKESKQLLGFLTSFTRGDRLRVEVYGVSWKSEEGLKATHKAFMEICRRDGRNGLEFHLSSSSSSARDAQKPKKDESGEA